MVLILALRGPCPEGGVHGDGRAARAGHEAVERGQLGWYIQGATSLKNRGFPIYTNNTRRRIIGLWSKNTERAAVLVFTIAGGQGGVHGGGETHAVAHLVVDGVRGDGALPCDAPSPVSRTSLRLIHSTWVYKMLGLKLHDNIYAKRIFCIILY